MALGTVPAGEQRSRFLAIGLSDNTVRVISLDPQDCLQPLSMQALPATPESLCIVEMAMGGLESESGRLGGLFLNIGLSVRCVFSSMFVIVIHNNLLRLQLLYHVKAMTIAALKKWNLLCNLVR